MACCTSKNILSSSDDNDDDEQRDCTHQHNRRPAAAHRCQDVVQELQQQSSMRSYLSRTSRGRFVWPRVRYMMLLAPIGLLLMVQLYLIGAQQIVELTKSRGPACAWRVLVVYQQMLPQKVGTTTRALKAGNISSSAYPTTTTTRATIPTTTTTTTTIRAAAARNVRALPLPSYGGGLLLSSFLEMVRPSKVVQCQPLGLGKQGEARVPHRVDGPHLLSGFHNQQQQWEALFIRNVTRRAALSGSCWFIDSGAGNGEESIYAARLGCSVLAFETRKDNLAWMERAARPRGFAGEAVSCLGSLSDTIGEMPIAASAVDPLRQILRSRAPQASTPERRVPSATSTDPYIQILRSRAARARAPDRRRLLTADGSGDDTTNLERVPDWLVPTVSAMSCACPPEPSLQAEPGRAHLAPSLTLDALVEATAGGVALSRHPRRARVTFLRVVDTLPGDEVRVLRGALGSVRRGLVSFMLLELSPLRWAQGGVSLAQGAATLRAVLDAGCTAWLSPQSHFYRNFQCNRGRTRCEPCGLPAAIADLPWSAAPAADAPLRTVTPGAVDGVLRHLATQHCSAYWFVSCDDTQ